MANDSTNLFYWYRRYKVRATDMTAFQRAMIETTRGLSEGMVGAAVLSGYQLSLGGGMVVNVSAGIAAGASGYLEVLSGSTALNLSAATGVQPSRAIIVVSPAPTDANFITSPTSPFNSVPLNSSQRAIVKVIAGTPAQLPEYPAKGANDVILAGVFLPANATVMDASMLDFEVREIPGVNTKLSQNQVRLDDRLRPYRFDHAKLGIKPSQTVGSAPVGFAYSTKGSPSLYPLSGGSYVAADSFADFSTGLITGGDTTSSGFSPVIPGGSNAIVCVVTLNSLDKLAFAYGTQGTRAQCINAIKQQTLAGPGALPAIGTDLVLAYVVVTSFGGAFSDIQVFDARPFLGVGSGGGGGSGGVFKQETPTGTVNGSNAVFTLSFTPVEPHSLDFYVDENKLREDQYSLTGAVVTITDSDMVPVVGQTVYAKYLKTGAIPIPNVGGGGFAVQGSPGAPVVVDPAVGIISTPDPRQLKYVTSQGGVQPVTANPQISVGNNIGQEMVLVGTSNTNYPTLADGNGLSLNGLFSLKDGATLNLIWNGLVWSENSRR